MREHFDNLFRYNEWANRRLFVRLPEVVDKDPFTLALFSHLVIVEKVWLSRILRTGETFPIWDPIPLPELIRHLNQAAQQWSQYLSTLTDQHFKQQISYVNTKGVAFQNSLQEIATHTINHSTHHRGQIIVLMRRAGIEPPVLDYIVYARNE